MSEQPNIFNYATSELSQDAFIAWLLEWADPKYKPQNEKLHQVGLDFLRTLLATKKILLSEITNLEIKTQFHKIDVFVSFEMQGKSYGVIIEDKVFTSNHSNQLTKYKELIENKNYDVVVPIYFKTGFQHCYENIEENGYSSYTVKDFTEVLRNGIAQDVDNAILQDYYEYIIEREKLFDGAKHAFENYKSVPISKWDWWSCTGFFNDHKRVLDGNWGPVGNNKQPLLAFWFGHRDIDVTTESGNSITLKLYIDILYSNYTIKINFRIDLNKNSQTNNKIRNKIFDDFNPYLENADIKYKKPTFRKANKTMLLAQVINLDNSIYYNDLKDILLKHKLVLDEFVSDFNKHENKTIAFNEAPIE